MKYPSTSPYSLTPTVKNLYLDVMTNRPIPKVATDKLWAITSTYNLRPDLLALDLYGNSKLWWVFAQRNPNRLIDPLFDFVTGVEIYLPNVNSLKKSLGF